MSTSSTSNSEGPNSEGLIVLDQAFADGERHRRWALGATLFFVAAVAAVGLVDTLFPAARPRLVGEERRRDEQVRAAANLYDGSLARLLEQNLRLTSRTRQTLGAYYGAALFFGLHEVPSHLLRGRDGRLFMKDRAQIPGNETDDELLEETSAWLRAVDRRLASFGIHLVALPVPRKAALYADHLPAGTNVRAELDARLPAEIRRRGVTTVDLASLYRRALDDPQFGEDLYHNAGTHWTDAAQWLAAEETCRVAGLHVPVDERRERIERREASSSDTGLLTFLAARPPAALLQRLSRPEAAYLVTDQEGLELPHSNPPSVGRIAVVGTSFTEKRQLPALLAHCSQESVWNAAQRGRNPFKSLQSFLREQDHPEFLVLEMPNHALLGERDMPALFLLLADLPLAPERLVLHGFNTEKLKKRSFRMRFHHVAHSADGLVALVLRGRAGNSPVQVRLTVAGESQNALWRPDQPEIVLPLVAERPTNKLSFFIMADDATRVDAAELVTDLDDSHAWEGAPQALRISEDGWSQDFVFAELPVIPAQAGLVLRTRIRGGAFDGNLTVSVQPPGEEQPALQVDFTNADRQAPVVIDLDALAGRRVRKVRIAGSGKVGPRSKLAVRILPQSKLAGRSAVE